MKNRAKIILLSVFLLAVGGMITWYVYTSSINALDEQIKDKLEDIAFLTMNKIDRVFYERHTYMKTLASDPVISSRDLTPKQLAKRLTEIKKTGGTFEQLSFFALNGGCIADTSSAGPGRRSLEEKYRQDFARGQDYVMDVSPGDAAFCFAALVKDRGGAPLGVVASRMPVDKLHEVTKDAGGIHEFHKGFKVDLVNSEGLILYSNYNAKGILKDRSPEWEHVRTQLSGGGKAGSRIHYHQELGQEEIYAFAVEQGHEDFKGNGWVLLVNVPSKTAFSSATGLRNRVIIIAVAVGILSLSAVVLFFRLLSGWMEKQDSADAIDVAGKVTGQPWSAPDGPPLPSAEDMKQPELAEGAEELPHNILSNREYQIMLMIAGGKTLTEIGRELVLSVKTISTYRSRILKKLDLKNNVELTQYVLSRGLE